MSALPGAEVAASSVPSADRHAHPEDSSPVPWRTATMNTPGPTEALPQVPSPPISMVLSSPARVVHHEGDSGVAQRPRCPRTRRANPPPPGHQVSVCPANRASGHCTQSLAPIQPTATARLPATSPSCCPSSSVGVSATTAGPAQLVIGSASADPSIRQEKSSAPPTVPGFIAARQVELPEGQLLSGEGPSGRESYVSFAGFLRCDNKCCLCRTALSTARCRVK